MTLLCRCGAAATHYGAADTDCGDIDAYAPSCNSCALGDYEYCLECFGHIDGNESDSCGRCVCVIHAA